MITDIISEESLVQRPSPRRWRMRGLSRKRCGWTSDRHLKPTKELLVEHGGEGGKFVRPGEYEVTLTYGKTKSTQKLQVEIAAGIETR